MIDNARDLYATQTCFLSDYNTINVTPLKYYDWFYINAHTPVALMVIYHFY